MPGSKDVFILRMGSKQAYMRNDRQKAVEMFIIEGVRRIDEQMQDIADACVEAIIKIGPDEVNSERIHKMIIGLLDANREWAKSMRKPMKALG